jgi:uncharacterized protein YcbK (DUF882 family)
MSYRYFKLEEFACKETGDNRIDPLFVAWLDELRHQVGYPLVITSGYRSPLHSAEVGKTTPGAHAEGVAADLSLIHTGTSISLARQRIVSTALRMGCQRIGIGRTFVHVDLSETKPSPRMWDYY